MLPCVFSLDRSEAFLLFSLDLLLDLFFSRALTFSLLDEDEEDDEEEVEDFEEDLDDLEDVDDDDGDACSLLRIL